MSIQETKKQILSSIEEIEKNDVNKLFPENANATAWNNLTVPELSKYVKRVILLLRDLKGNLDVFDFVDFSVSQNITNNLVAFVSNLQSLQGLDANQIVSQHHSALNQLNQLNILLRNSGIYTEIQSIPNLDKKWTEITSATHIANELNKNKDDIQNGVALIKDMLSSKERLAQIIVNENNNFKSLASKYKNRDWLWLLGGVLAAMSVVWLFKYLILGELSQGGSDIEAGEAILRVSALVLPSYLTYYFLNRYTHINNMYDKYSFKDSVLGNMKDLGGLYTVEMNEFITKESLKVLLKEPVMKVTEKSHSDQLVNKVVSSTLDAKV